MKTKYILVLYTLFIVFYLGLSLLSSYEKIELEKIQTQLYLSQTPEERLSQMNKEQQQIKEQREKQEILKEQENIKEKLRVEIKEELEKKPKFWLPFLIGGSLLFFTLLYAIFNSSKSEMNLGSLIVVVGSIVSVIIIIHMIKFTFEVESQVDYLINNVELFKSNN